MLRDTIRSIAVSQSVSTSCPFSRIRGRVRRSLLLTPCQDANKPFGPSRPWLTMSTARPRTPTIVPSLTAISTPQPLLHSTHAD